MIDELKARWIRVENHSYWKSRSSDDDSQRTRPGKERRSSRFRIENSRILLEHERHSRFRATELIRILPEARRPQGNGAEDEPPF